MRLAISTLLALLLIGCTTQPEEKSGPTAEQEAAIQALMAKHNAKTMGIGKIEGGELVWQRHYGERAPGDPADAQTMYNTASVSKAVTAETAISLIGKGLISLDDLVAEHYTYPDLADDPRYQQLTLRHLLNHTSGFRNWPMEYPDGVLAFDNAPGETFGYSGIGFTIFARYVEEKLGKPFPQVVREEVHEPLGLQLAGHEQAPWMAPHRVMPLDEEGAFLTSFPFEDGYWNPADEYYTSVEDHARFMIASWRNTIGQAGAPDLRYTIQTSIADSPIWGCQGAVDPCPDAMGHSVGWFVFKYGERANLQHGGNDMSEAAMAYIKSDSGDGMIVFVNAPTPEGIPLYLKVIDLLDEEQDFTGVFWAIVERFFAPVDETAEGTATTG